MNISETALDFYQTQIRILIWSGFFNEEDFDVHLDDLTYDEEANEHLVALRRFGLATMDEKKLAEVNWPAETDYDRLAKAFSKLDMEGILALHNAGYTRSDAHADAWEYIRESEPGRYRGFCFYHGQDVERAVEGSDLFIGFDAVADGADEKIALGKAIAAALANHDFDVPWNGDPETRMSITNIEWKKRTDWIDLPTTSAIPEQISTKKAGFFSRLFNRP